LPGAGRLGKEDPDREPLSQLLMLGISLPRSYVSAFRSGAGTCRSFLVKP
jgi:hypothetical protein